MSTKPQSFYTNRIAMLLQQCVMVLVVSMLSMMTVDGKGESTPSTIPRSTTYNEGKETTGTTTTSVPTGDKESFNLDAFFIEASAHMFSDHIGSKLLTERVRRFAEFARSPPFGEFSTFCEAFEKNTKALFYFGVILKPDLSFLYYTQLGDILRMGNKDKEEVWYHDFFDIVSDFTHCQGQDGDFLVEKISEFYALSLYDIGPDENDKLLGELRSMNESLLQLEQNDTVHFNPSCKLEVFREYFKIKLYGLGSKVDELDVNSTDNAVIQIFDEYLMLTPMFSTLFLCYGYKGVMKSEAAKPDSYIYTIRDHVRALMLKVEERANYRMESLKTMEEKLDTVENSRYFSYIVQAGSEVYCGDFDSTVDKDSVINVKICGETCDVEYETEQRKVDEKKEEGCVEIEGKRFPCSVCLVVTPVGSVDDTTSYSNVSTSMTIGKTYVMIFPGRNVSQSIVPPKLTPEDMETLFKYNIAKRRPPVENFHFHKAPERQFYIPHTKTDDFDWRTMCWNGLKLYIGMTISIWVLYFGLAYLPHFLFWIRRRRLAE